jgi:hypothetical protein
MRTGAGGLGARGWLAIASVVFVVSGFSRTSIAQLSYAVPEADVVKKRLAGTWMLVKYEVYSENGEARPGNYDVGRLTYGEREMDAHLLRSGGKEAPTTDEARAAAFRAYLGYFGPYTIDVSKRVVVHHVTGSSRPDWIGSDQVRHYDFSSNGSQLILMLKSGERVTQRLTWERVR